MCCWLFFNIEGNTAMMLPHVGTNCPLAYGNYLEADTTRGITLDTNMLGRIYYDRGEARQGLASATYQTGEPRYIMVVKNASGGTLARNMAVAFATAATGDFFANITGLGSANGRIAGFVEDGYLNTVPNGAYFRLVVEGLHYAQYYGLSDSQVATVPGEPLVCAGSGKVYGQDVAVAAGSATFGQTNGVLGYAWEVTANDSTSYDVYKKIMVKTYFM